MSDKPELYLQPKGLAHDLCARFGLCISVGYIYAIKRESAVRKDGLFVAHGARTSEVYRWMKENPSFRIPRRNSASQLYST